MSFRAVFAAALFAVFVDLTIGNTLPNWAYAFVIPVWVLGCVALGYLGGNPALAVFAPTWVVAALIHERWFYDAPAQCGDKFCGSPTEGIGWLLVFALLIAPGAAARTLRTQSRGAGEREHRV